jgi:hypothetical protein
VETESHVVSRPVTVSIAKDGFEESDSVSKRGRSVIWIETIEDPVTKGVEPGLHAVGELSGPWDQFDRSDGEAGCFKQTKVELR